MSLCINRADGDFGTYSGYVNTCFQDVVTVPLPALLLILAFFLCLATKGSGRDSEDGRERGVQLHSMDAKSTFSNAGLTSRENPGRYTDLGDSRRTTASGIGSGGWLGALLLGGCSFIILGLMGMHLLQIIRLSDGLLGMGLIPICLGALLLLLTTLIIPTHASNKFRLRARPHWFPWTLAVLVFTVGMAIVEGVELHYMIYFENKLGETKINKTTSKQPYTITSREIDVGVICGLYAVLTIAYISLAAVDQRRR